MNWNVSGNSFLWRKKMIDKFLSKIKYARSVSKKVPIPKITNVFAAVFFTIFFNFWVEGWKQVPCFFLLFKETNQSSLFAASSACLLVSRLPEEPKTWWLCWYGQTLGSFPVALLSFHGPSKVSQGSFYHTRKHFW